MRVTLSLSLSVKLNVLIHKILLVSNGYECKGKLKWNRIADNQPNEVLELNCKNGEWMSDFLLNCTFASVCVMCVWCWDEIEATESTLQTTDFLSPAQCSSAIFSNYYRSFICRFNLYWNYMLTPVVRCLNVWTVCSLANRGISRISHVERVSPFISIDTHSMLRADLIQIAHRHTLYVHSTTKSKSFKLHFYAVVLTELN